MHTAGDDHGTVEARGTRVLLVDDDPSVIDLASQYLEHALDDVTVRAVTDPHAAIDILRTEHVDCVVSDYSMPEVNGLDLLEVVRTETPDTRFVLFSGSADQALLAGPDAEGIDRFVRKGEGDAFGRLADAIAAVRS